MPDREGWGKSSEHRRRPGREDYDRPYDDYYLLLQALEHCNRHYMTLRNLPGKLKLLPEQPAKNCYPIPSHDSALRLQPPRTAPPRTP